MTTNDDPEEPEPTLEQFTDEELRLGLRVAAAALGRATMHNRAIREELRVVRAGRDVLVGLLSEDGDGTDPEELDNLRLQITQAHLTLNELGVASSSPYGRTLPVAERIVLLAKQLIGFADPAALSAIVVNGGNGVNGGRPQ